MYFIHCDPHTELSLRSLTTLTLFNRLQGAAKSSTLQCFVNISTMNRNFCKKLYTAIYRS